MGNGARLMCPICVEMAVMFKLAGCDPILRRFWLKNNSNVGWAEERNPTFSGLCWFHYLQPNLRIFKTYAVLGSDRNPCNNIDSSTSIKDSSASIKDSFTSIKDSFTSIKDSFTSIKDSSASIKDSFTSIKDSFTSIKASSASIKDSSASIKDSSASIKDSSASIKDSFTSIKGALRFRAHSQQPPQNSF